MNKTGKPRRRKLLKRIIVLVIVLLLIAGAGFIAYRSLKAEYTVTYDSYTATRGSISNSLSFSGNLSLIDSATYIASSNSSVKTIYAPAGTEVSKDDKLLRLSNGETVTAGFDGRVNAVEVDEDDDVTVGQALLTLADFTHLQVAFRVDEYDIGDVAVGQACTITVTALERTFESEIAAINYISASGGNVAYYTATAYVDVDEGVLPGMQVTVTIPQEEAWDVVVLKVDALSFDFTNQAYVWMKNDAGELEQVYVKTGVSNGNYLEITEGLNEGDEVFVEAKDTDTAAGLFAGMFGSQRFNQRSGDMPEGFNPSNMGERGSWSRDGSSSGPGSGQRPSMGGGGQ